MELSKKGRKIFPLEKIYPTCFQLYLYPPNGDISLEEFEELATLRQRVLHEISNVRERISHGDLIWKDHIEKEMRKCTKSLQLESYLEDVSITAFEGNFKTAHNYLSTQNAKMQWLLLQRKKDHISHYILRLAYCRSEELRRWFLTQETELMRYRLQRGSERERMIKRYPEQLPLIRVTIPAMAEIKERKKQGLRVTDEEKLLSEEASIYSAVTKEDGESDDMKKDGNAYDGTIQRSADFYKVKFTDVLNLVQHREVIVKGGCAYLPLNNERMVISYICNKFCSLLSQDLVRMLSHVQSVVDQDERIAPLLKSMRYKHTNFSTGSDVDEKISRCQLDTLSRESFAPCMRHLHETQRKVHHLRYFGRLQYGLFLKSINLTLDQALAFWKFDKQYMYNIRHSFAKEGKRTNYTSYSCRKIIMSKAPGPGDHHGCPFRHWNEDHVKAMLTSYGVSDKSVEQIVDYVQDSHYQLACQKYFDVTHNLEQSVFSLEHPSQYFFESRKVRRGHTGATAPEVTELLPDIEALDNFKMSEEDMKEFEKMDWSE